MAFVYRDKIQSGGIYLIDQRGYVSPEFGFDHYCILIRTNYNDLYLSFPLTTSKKRLEDSHTMRRPAAEEEIILFNQSKPISKDRVKGQKLVNGELDVITIDELEIIMNAYHDYLNSIQLSTKMSINQYNKNKKDSFANMSLQCKESYKAIVNQELDYDDLVISYTGGKLTHNLISVKNEGEYVVEFLLKDKYSQKIKKRVLVVMEKDLAKEK